MVVCLYAIQNISNRGGGTMSEFLERGGEKKREQHCTRLNGKKLVEIRSCY